MAAPSSRTPSFNTRSGNFVERIVLALVLAMWLTACGAEGTSSRPTPKVQPTIALPHTPGPQSTARPQPTREPQPTPVPLRVYVVQSGDTLYSLARRFGVDLHALAEFNRIADPRKIYVGQRLLVPSGAIIAPTPPARPTPPRIHGVDCEFRFGFRELFDLMPVTVGQCLENEQYDISGNSFQRTAGGLLVWRKVDSLASFTDGSWTWIHGSDGIEKVRNGDRFHWDPPDPLLAQALETLRATPTGAQVYTLLMQSGATAQFGPMEGLVSQYSPFRNLILINEQYRHESPEALAHTLIWPALGLHNVAARSRSWAECMERVVNQEVAQAQWWRERFGEHGKENPTDLEQWANYGFKLYVNESLRYWVQLSPQYREQCAEDGAPPHHIDPTLAKAYRTALMGGKSALGKTAAATVIAAKTDVAFGPAEGFGYYFPAHNRIVVSEELRYASADVLAAVLIHETVHVAQYQKRRGLRSPAECVENEIEAFKAEAQWWSEWHGQDGKARPDGDAERHMNELLKAWRNEWLEAFVLLSDGYQEQCLGGVVDS